MRTIKTDIGDFKSYFSLFCYMSKHNLDTVEIFEDVFFEKYILCFKKGKHDIKKIKFYAISEQSRRFFSNITRFNYECVELISSCMEELRKKDKGVKL